MLNRMIHHISFLKVEICSNLTETAQVMKVITAQINFPYITQVKLITRRTRPDYFKCHAVIIMNRAAKKFPKT
jgi:hypothetical protein